MQWCVSVISGLNFPETSEKSESHMASLALILDGQLSGSLSDESIAQVIWSSNQIKVQGGFGDYRANKWDADTSASSAQASAEKRGGQG